MCSDAVPPRLLSGTNFTSSAVTSGNCIYDFSDFVCIDRYGSSMSGDFGQNVSLDIASPHKFIDTYIPRDTPFDQVSKTTFVWNSTRAAVILGQDPQYEYIINASTFDHEAPVLVA